MLAHLLALQDTGQLLALSLATGVASQLHKMVSNRQIMKVIALRSYVAGRNKGGVGGGAYAVLGNLQSTLLLAEPQQLCKSVRS